MRSCGVPAPIPAEIEGAEHGRVVVAQQVEGGEAPLVDHDGLALDKAGLDRVRLYTRHGTDFTVRFPKITAAVESLGVRSCVLDGEAIVIDEFGLPNFNALRYRLHDDAAVLCAFDLLELDGKDLRWRAIEQRKARLGKLLRAIPDGIAYNKHFSGDGPNRLLSAAKRTFRRRLPRCSTS